jgi:ArsR family transcriptional regulator
MRLASCCLPGGTCNTETEMYECVGKLGKDLGIAPSTISHHIKTLDSLAAFFKQPVNV